MCDVPSIAVFCSESIECFPGKASKFFLKLLVTIPVVPVTTGIIVHFRFHIRGISIHKLLYFNFYYYYYYYYYYVPFRYWQLIAYANLIYGFPCHLYLLFRFVQTSYIHVYEIMDEVDGYE